MITYFKQRKYCTEEKRTSLFGKTYLFRFFNGRIVEVSRDMKSPKEWIGYWKVTIHADGRVLMTDETVYKRKKSVERLLERIKSISI